MSVSRDFAAITVTAERQVHFNRRAMRPLRDVTDYRCTGPDGKQYQNTNKATLVSLLKQHYGRGITIEFVEVAR